MKYHLAFTFLAASFVSACDGDDDNTGAVAKIYGQCGGEGWSGPTACADGAVCQQQNPYYYQCVAGQTTFESSVVASSAAASVVASASSSAAEVASPSSAAVAASTPDGGPVTAAAAAASVVSSSAAPVVSSSAQAVSSAAPSSSQAASSAAPASSQAASSSSSATASAGSGAVYKASFTQYGSTDTWGSGSCNVNTAACGFYSSPGYNAAASQNLFGVGPGAGAGPGCGTCWALTPSTDSSGKALSGASSIIVKINNLCPAQGNPLCSQDGLTGTNQYGANVNFDLCIDDGANTALFGSSGTALALGTATQVDCSKWQGTDITKRMTI